ncbi:MAG: hypothetical protein ACOWWO_03110 [Peptococcaceae bacterium]
MLRKSLTLFGLVLIIAILFPAAALAGDGAVIKVGQDIEVKADENYDAVISIGGNIIVDGHVRDAVVAVGGNVEINGTVGDAVVTVGGDATINNEISGDLVVIGSNTRLGPQAVIRGDLVMIGVDLTADPHAQIKGAQTEISISNLLERFPKNFTLFGVSLASFLYGLLLIALAVMSLLVLLIGLVFPDSLKRSKNYALKSPGKSFLLGLLFAIFFLPISFVLFITIIGIPLLLFFWFMYGIMALWGMAVLTDILGEKILSLLGHQGKSTALELIIGIVLFVLISQIPVIGWVVLLLSKTLAIGIAAISYLGFRK